jgi:anti-anti-sigma regulatory factor
MTLRIQRSTDGNTVVFTVSGRIEGGRLGELQEVLTSERDGCRIVVDLQDVGLVDRDTIMFLVHCAREGIELAHCPGYIREWILRERDVP